MLEWSIPEAEDEDWINSCIAVSGTMASDASFANIYLLRNKYSTKISRYKDFIIRKYSGKGARCGYTFPLGKGDVAKALAEIEKDAKECGERLQFAFVTEEQKEVLENAMPARFCYSSDAGDSDYIYLRSELASLSGKAFHKKKNHFSKFVINTMRLVHVIFMMHRKLRMRGITSICRMRMHHSWLSTRL